MTEEQRVKIIRVAAHALMQFDVPGAPAGAIGPPSLWWTEAETVVSAVEAYFKEAFGVCNHD